MSARRSTAEESSADRNRAPWWLYAVLTLSAVTCWCVVLSEQLP